MDDCCADITVAPVVTDVVVAPSDTVVSTQSTATAVSVTPVTTAITVQTVGTTIIVEPLGPTGPPGPGSTIEPLTESGAYLGGYAGGYSGLALAWGGYQGGYAGSYGDAQPDVASGYAGGYGTGYAPYSPAPGHSYGDYKTGYGPVLRSGVPVLTVDPVTGDLAEIPTIVIGYGERDAGLPVGLGNDGLIDRSLLPPLGLAPLVYELVAASSWSTPHPFPYPPDVQLVERGVARVYMGATYPDGSHVYLLFPTPYTGKVVLR